MTVHKYKYHAWDNSIAAFEGWKLGLSEIRLQFLFTQLARYLCVLLLQVLALVPAKSNDTHKHTSSTLVYPQDHYLTIL